MNAAPVAQSCTLPYRRVALCGARLDPKRQSHSAAQFDSNAPFIQRPGRLQIGDTAECDSALQPDAVHLLMQRDEPISPPAPLSPNQRAWRRFRRNRPALLGLGFLVLLVAIVLVWPALGFGVLGRLLPEAVR